MKKFLFSLVILIAISFHIEAAGKEDMAVAGLLGSAVFATGCLYCHYQYKKLDKSRYERDKNKQKIYNRLQWLLGSCSVASGVYAGLKFYDLNSKQNTSLGSWGNGGKPVVEKTLEEKIDSYIFEGVLFAANFSGETKELDQQLRERFKPLNESLEKRFAEQKVGQLGFIRSGILQASRALCNYVGADEEKRDREKVKKEVSDFLRYIDGYDLKRVEGLVNEVEKGAFAK